MLSALTIALTLAFHSILLISMPFCHLGVTVVAVGEDQAVVCVHNPFISIDHWSRVGCGKLQFAFASCSFTHCRFVVLGQECLVAVNVTQGSVGLKSCC